MAMGCKICLSDPMDGNDMLWNGSEEDRNLRSEHMEDEGTDCEDWNLTSLCIINL